MDSDSTMLLVALGLLVCCSAFFSASEAALLSCNKVRLMNMHEDGNKKAGLVLKLLDVQGKVLSTILVGNNVANIAASSLATQFAISIWGSIGVGIATGVTTIVILVCGEVVPKNLATGMANSLIIKIAPVLRFLTIILTPVVWLLDKISKLAKKISKTEEDPLITEDELKLLVSAGQEEGFLDESEKEMINSIFEFDETMVREIMVPRIDMVALNGEDTIDKALKLVVEAGHSRIPVYENSIDNIIGLLYAKDLLKNMDKDFTQWQVKSLVRSAYYIPENKYINDLLTEMRQKRVHMAIILDEYGGTAGLVTIEDLIEEIIGDIQDEYDSENELIEVLEDRVAVLADARALVYDVLNVLDVELDEESDSDTIGGLVFEHLGGVPQLGDEIIFGILDLRVAGVDGHRVSKVEVRVIPQEEEEQEEDWFARKRKEKEKDTEAEAE